MEWKLRNMFKVRKGSVLSLRSFHWWELYTMSDNVRRGFYSFNVIANADNITLSCTNYSLGQSFNLALRRR